MTAFYIKSGLNSLGGSYLTNREDAKDAKEEGKKKKKKKKKKVILW
ncbi:hypothetical protein [Microcoleus sp. PH2017_22_RUC_O_B]|nr:hypothetical protein [Microcoleus sp. PH2017_22_RUC_O_B]